MRRNVDNQQHTMTRTLRPCSGNLNSLASYVMEFVSLVVTEAQDQWAYTDALNAWSGVLQWPLQNISRAAIDAW